MEKGTKIKDQKAEETTECSFTPKVLWVELLKDLQLPKLDRYNRTRGPLYHVRNYQSTMALNGF